jgi:hypothetical protein
MLKIVLFAMYDIKVKTESRKSSLSWVYNKKSSAIISDCKWATV